MHIDEFLTYHGVVVPVECIHNLEAIIRKQTFGFICRLRKSCNTIVQTLENVWISRIQLWHSWFEVLYTNR